MSCFRDRDLGWFVSNHLRVNSYTFLSSTSFIYMLAVSLMVLNRFANCAAVSDSELMSRG